MRHRKKYLLATMLLATAHAGLCFWPHSNPEAVRALAAMRELVEIGDAPAVQQVAAAKLPDDAQIECRMVVAAVNMTDATTGLFAKPGRVGGEGIVGRVKSERQYLTIMQSTPVIQIEQMPVLMALAGSKTGIGIASSGEVEVGLAPVGGGPAPMKTHFRDERTHLGVIATITAGGAIQLELDFERALATRKKMVATPEGPMEVPDTQMLSAKAKIELRAGETLVIGGLSQKRSERVLTKLPGVSEIPGIGPWFTINRECEFEEELVILVTPRIVTPVAAK